MCYDIAFTVKIAQLTDYFPDLVFDSQIDIDFRLSISSATAMACIPLFTAIAKTSNCIAA